MSYLFLVSPDVVGIGSEHFVVYLSCVYIYKERAAPPIGGPALHDSGVKTVQWRKREGHDSYQEVEVYIYKWAITKNRYTRSGFFAERVLSKTK